MDNFYRAKAFQLCAASCSASKVLMLRAVQEKRQPRRHHYGDSVIPPPSRPCSETEPAASEPATPFTCPTLFARFVASAASLARTFGLAPVATGTAKSPPQESSAGEGGEDKRVVDTATMETPDATESSAPFRKHLRQGAFKFAQAYMVAARPLCTLQKANAFLLSATTDQCDTNILMSMVVEMIERVSV
ncbi:hypothetical protein BDK51DRAFT_36538 [Blyttiomyces helicus]|uniref:Uncharacterized protein n=1 Tax=Blyttiomyces helicus TaxID=388810 RepID=A0A4P9WL36_9FUNG|nr:hypothetical protein BDK51DRAFT_36538 [Blyttiomyces helicus]|eukprot:RKO92865.1 hypothetical protein BDK51DRAFT_36538 [Blyttiomyces helicus]